MYEPPSSRRSRFNRFEAESALFWPEMPLRREADECGLFHTVFTLRSVTWPPSDPTVKQRLRERGLAVAASQTRHRVGAGGCRRHAKGGRAVAKKSKKDKKKDSKNKKKK